MTRDGSAEKSVSVVIPVLNAEKLLPRLLEILECQKPVPPDEIVLVDSSSTDRTSEIAASSERVKLIPIARFSHGLARNMGAREARGEFIVFMSQDALPANDSWLAAILAPFSDERTGAVFSRQVPRPGAPPTECFFLQYHFPPEQTVRRRKEGEERLTFQNVFFSNVSSAARRSVVMRFPFDEELIMSEVQQFARDLISAGYEIAYRPDSVVVHSHNYSLKTVFQRYFDSVYSLTKVFSGHDMKESAGIGLRYLVREAAYILRHHPFYLPYYFLYTLAKTGGTVAGHFADRMPRSVCEKLSMHSYYWARKGWSEVTLGLKETK